MPEATSTVGAAEPDDETLVGLARSGDRPARDELFLRHRGIAYRVAYRLLGNPHDAEDAVQDGLIKAFAGLEHFDGRSGFRTWLVRIVSNTAIDLGRKRRRRNVFAMGARSNGQGPARGRPAAGGTFEQGRPEPVTTSDPAHRLHREDLRHTLDLALARLSPKLRITFVLFAEAGLSYKEIAESQDVPIGTVMSRLHDARQKLQSCPEIQALEEDEAG
jgi:RNA polymerase sigma-70 factor, ECF subfamily